MEFFSIFSLTLGASRQDVMEQKAKLLASENLDATTKSYLEGLDNDSVDQIFKKYDKDGNNLITQDETSLVELDFDEEDSSKSGQISKQNFLEMNLPELVGVDLGALFDYLDVNKRGFISKSDIENLTPETIQQFKVQDAQEPQEETANIPVDDNVGNESVQSAASSGGSGSSSSGGGRGSASSNNIKPEETLEALREQKQKVSDDFDAKIKSKNDEMNDTISQDESISTELKEQHANLTSELNGINSNIQTKESEISGYDSQIHSLNSNISGMESELSTLEGRTPEDADTKQQIASRKSALRQKISDAKSELDEIEGKKQVAQGELEGLKGQKGEIEASLNEVEQEIMANNPELKAAIESTKSEIKDLETQKEAQITQLDNKISELSSKEIQDSKSAGQILGSPMGQYMSDLFDNIADRPDIVARSEGQKDYCSRYIASCITELLRQNGIEGIQVPQSPSGQLNWVNSYPGEIKVYNYRNMSEEERRNFQPTPGMIVRMQWQGTSSSNPQMHTKNHVQFVKEYLGDGKYIAQDWDSGKGVGEELCNLYDDDRIVAFIDWTPLLARAQNYG